MIHTGTVETLYRGMNLMQGWKLEKGNRTNRLGSIKEPIRSEHRTIRYRRDIVSWIRNTLEEETEQ